MTLRTCFDGIELCIATTELLRMKRIDFLRNIHSEEKGLMKNMDRYEEEAERDLTKKDTANNSSLPTRE